MNEDPGAVVKSKNKNSMHKSECAPGSNIQVKPKQFDIVNTKVSNYFLICKYFPKFFLFDLH